MQTDAVFLQLLVMGLAVIAMPLIAGLLAKLLDRRAQVPSEH